MTSRISDPSQILSKHPPKRRQVLGTHLFMSRLDLFKNRTISGWGKNALIQMVAKTGLGSASRFSVWATIIKIGGVPLCHFISPFTPFPSSKSHHGQKEKDRKSQSKQGSQRTRKGTPAEPR